MRPSFGVIAAVLSVAMIGGCFNFGATMAGGDAGAPPSDTGVDVTLDQSSVRDAFTPGDVIRDVDASRDADASLDAEAETDVGAVDTGTRRDGGTFCETYPRHDGGIFFCDEFDDHPLPGSWQTWGELGGTLVESDANAVSPPNCAREIIAPIADGTAINVALRTPLPVPRRPSTLRFAFEVEPVQIDTTPGAAIVLGTIDFIDAAGYRYTVGLDVNVAEGLPALALGEQTGVANGGDLPDGAPPTFTNHPLPPNQPLSMKAWTAVEIELDWTSSSLEGKVFVGGDLELLVSLDPTVVPTMMQIGIGTSFVTEYDSGPSPTWEVRYDNVVFTAD